MNARLLPPPGRACLSGVDVPPTSGAGEQLPVDARVCRRCGIRPRPLRRPATYNTINKLALGIADTYPLTSAAELMGRGIPTVIIPFVNAALAARAPFQRAIVDLRAEGACVLSGPDDNWEPHPPGTGSGMQAMFPWQRAFRIAEEATDRRMHP
ncbi:hypothetical protein DMB66_52355 [Actinoplanes sp. ATCC 53533]|nr:hypothetical protein DMB66_52355 [Actinoplanes sp. ATCC 53533]